MKKVYIIHGWGEPADEPIYTWLKSELEKMNIEVHAPEMPNTDEPKIEEWVGKLRSIAGEVPDKNVFFIGHSMGCQTILRYLADIDESGEFGGAILIAPWFTLTGLESDEEREIAKSWINTPINIEKSISHLPEGKIFAIFSDDDPFVPEENWEKFKRELGVKIIMEHNKGHLSNQFGVTELPSVLQAVKELINL